jgi:glutathione S-transferase
MSLPILYSFRRCPYAIRARLALAYAGISYELREVSLKNKPQAMLDISPKGTTPVMQIGTNYGDSCQDLRILEESLDIMNWAVQHHDPQRWQDLSDHALTLTQQLISANDHQFKQALDRYKYPNQFPERSQEFYRHQAEEFLQILELQLAESEMQNFLIRDRQTLADVAIFPFVRQFAYVNIDWFQASPYPYLQKWLQWHETSHLFELVMQKFPVWTPDQKAIVVIS